MRLTEVFEQELKNNNVGYPASEVIDLIRNPGPSKGFAIRYGLQAMRHEGIGLRAQGEILTPHAAEIYNYLNKLLSENDRNLPVIAQIFQLLTIGVKPPESSDFLEKHKDTIVYFILILVRDSHRLAAKEVIKSLKSIGVIWPEFDMIMKSLNAPKKVTEREEDSGQLEFAKHAIPGLFKKNNPGAALNIINALYKADPDNVEWLKNNVTPVLLKHYNKKKILQWVVKSVEAVTMPRIVSARNLLKKLGVELPDIKTIIDDNKDHIIKRYLQVIQNHKSVEPVIKDIQHLRELGITWPELDIIEKSYSSEKSAEPLDETKSLWEIYSMYLISAVKQHNEEGALRYWRELVDNNRRDVAYMVVEIAKNSPDNAAWFFDLVKDDIVRCLLRNVKSQLDYKLGEAKYAIRALKKVGVAWPELDIIVKSLRAYKKLSEDGQNLDNNDELAAHKEWQIQHILDEIDIQLSNTYNSWINWVYQLRPFNAMPRLKPIVLKRKKNVLAWAMNQIKTGKIFVLSELQHLLTEADIHIPELDTIVEDNKDKIVKFCLVKMKQGGRDGVESVVKSLRKSGIDWPELHIIERSLAADKKPIKETIKVTQDNSGYLLRELITAIEDRELQDAVDIFYAFSSHWLMNQVLSYIVMHSESRDNVKWFFDSQKTQIMRHILEEMQEDSTSGYVDQTLKYLDRAGVNWPELAVVKKSLAADIAINKTRNPEDY